MAPDPSPVPASATLAAIRADIGARDDLITRMQPGRSYPVAEFNGAQDRLAERVPSLLAAVEAVLKLAGDWDNESVRLDAVAARSFPGGDRGVIAAARAGVFQGCAEALREAITAALTGAQPEASDG